LPTRKCGNSALRSVPVSLAISHIPVFSRGLR
jgi:hypothetical protein